jgi:hypothetical protein
MFIYRVTITYHDASTTSYITAANSSAAAYNAVEHNETIAHIDVQHINVTHDAWDVR